jgi:hypothetical protein
MGIFLLGGLSTPGSLFRHTFSKNTLNIKIYAFRFFFVLKTPFLTSHKLIFSFLVPFQRFQAIFGEVQQILVKYVVFMYLGDYQRFYQLFFKGFSIKFYIMVICIQKVYSCWQMLFQLLYMVAQSSFLKKNSCEFANCPASQVKKNQAHLLNREPLSWFCVSDLLTDLKGESCYAP